MRKSILLHEKVNAKNNKSWNKQDFFMIIALATALVLILYIIFHNLSYFIFSLLCAVLLVLVLISLICLRFFTLHFHLWMASEIGYAKTTPEDNDLVAGPAESLSYKIIEQSKFD